MRDPLGQGTSRFLPGFFNHDSLTMLMGKCQTGRVPGAGKAVVRSGFAVSF